MTKSPAITFFSVSHLNSFCLANAAGIKKT